MKQLTKRILPLLLLLALVCSVITPVSAAKTILTSPTGYDSASDVVYVKDGKYILNWGARGEDCVFLSTYAQNFYTGSNTFASLSEKEGSKSQNAVPNSALYKALQTLMKSKHTHQTTYGETRYEYCYTDCVKSNDSQISSFYSGILFGSEWDQGKTWNREHTWPASKSLSGRPGNGDDGEGADIMMLRPTLQSENSGRGNTAYGEGSGFYDPGEDIRGDCARIMLYTYVRWGNTSNMWGKSGVIESQNILLKWMEEDPVDTWEMGRNDAVQSITGTRNVFVDYPELAFLMFGREVPDDMVTPSSEAKNGIGGGATTNPGTDTPGTTTCTHSATEIRNKKTATCTAAGYTGDTYCKNCDKKISSGSAIAAKGHTNSDGNNSCDVCGTLLTCEHRETELRDVKEATCKDSGYTGDTHCASCGTLLVLGESIAKTAHKEVTENESQPTCRLDGYTGDTVCELCGEVLATGEVIPAIGSHTFGDWNTVKEPTDTTPGSREHVCQLCGRKETEEIHATGKAPDETTPDASQTDEPKDDNNTLVIIIAAAVVLLGGGAATAIVIVKKKKKLD